MTYVYIVIIVLESLLVQSWYVWHAYVCLFVWVSCLCTCMRNEISLDQDENMISMPIADLLGI